MLVEQLMQQQVRMPLSFNLHFNYIKGGPLDTAKMTTLEQYFMPLAKFILRKDSERCTPKLLTPQHLAAIVHYNAFSSTGPNLRAQFATAPTTKPLKQAKPVA